MQPQSDQQLPSLREVLAAKPKKSVKLPKIIIRKSGIKVLYKTPEVHSVMARTSVCTHCGAKLFPGENKGLCCRNGKIKLPANNEYPDEMMELLRNRTFRNDIRKYNSILTFTSTGVQLDRDLTPNGIFTYRIHGQISHRIGSLLPEAGEQPKFAQLYIFDTDNEVQIV